MGTKVIAAVTTTAPNKSVMNGMTTGERGAQIHVESAVRKSNDVSNDNDLYFKSFKPTIFFQGTTLLF